MILSAFSSHQINKAHRGKLNAFLSICQFICLLVCLSIYSLIPFLGSGLKEDSPYILQDIVLFESTALIIIRTNIKINIYTFHSHICSIRILQFHTPDPSVRLNSTNPN